MLVSAARAAGTWPVASKGLALDMGKQLGIRPANLVAPCYLLLDDRIVLARIPERLRTHEVEVAVHVDRIEPAQGSVGEALQVRRVVEHEAAVRQRRMNL